MTRHVADDHLKRLPRDHYQGHAYLHWSLTIKDRKTGWLTPACYYKFRELLAHTMFRYGVTCPIYCCMPDHIHLMWIGLFDGTDQLNANKYFRRQMNEVLGKIDFQFQRQAYDNVLNDDERVEAAFEAVCEYIARNPERQGIVGIDQFQVYTYTDCLIPGAPEVKFSQDGFWDTFWRITSVARKKGLLMPGNKV
jgi:REP element-mobilizing transposase RayT